jgi:Universal stress protein UspA and related nucleotide-binding proteins
MIKNFIVPIDFSDDSIKGLDIAALFSTKTSVNIQMVYVQKRVSENFPSETREEYNIANDKLEKLVAAYSPKLGNDSKLRYIIKKGPKVYKEIVEQVESYKGGLIAMSTHGASGFEEFFIGSNALRIISATTRPVITIRKCGVPSDIKKIVMPIDNMPETRQKVPMTAEIARLFGAEIHVIEVSSSHNARVLQRLKGYSKQVCTYLQEHNIPYLTQTVFGDNVADITVDYANKIGADMISIITEQNDTITNLIVGNFAQRVLNTACIPVLNITPGEIKIKDSFNTYGE